MLVEEHKKQYMALNKIKWKIFEKSIRIRPLKLKSTHIYN